MKNTTRALYHAYLKRQQELNGVPDATTKFTVTPSVQQTLERRIQESSDFLRSINIIPVDELKGEKVMMGVSGSLAGRTDTSSADRPVREMHALDDQGYECKQTNFDYSIGYNTLDTWAKFPNFQAMLRDMLVSQQAIDRITCGWHGTSAAATTNRTTNPLLQDVNIGWLKHIKTDAAAQVMDEGANANQIRVGTAAGADYATVDQLVFDATQTLLPSWYRNDNRLVAIVGNTLMADKLFPLYGETKPTEINAADMLKSQKRLGGYQAVQPVNFPSGTILITSLDNLSLYYQSGARRRAIMDNPKRDRIETYESSNEAYVVQDYQRCVLLKNITFTWS